jgi:adenylate cyclase
MRITFQNDQKSVELEPQDRSLLEISLSQGIPHFHACGGNAKCSTCRVLVLESLESLDPPNPKETALLTKKGWIGSDVRLACQTRPHADLSVRRLVIDELDSKLAQREASMVRGLEKELAVLFSDLADFTPFAENALPYDVVHLLDRYFDRMGEVVAAHRGYLDKTMGDGLMALFGLESDLDTSCLDAVACALDMLKELEEFNRYLAVQFNTRFRVRIGIHAGRVICGDFGPSQRRQFTALGDTVNVASRIEEANKTPGTWLLVSEQVYQRVREKVVRGLRVEEPLKGKTGTFHLVEIVGLRSVSQEILKKAG